MSNIKLAKLFFKSGIAKGNFENSEQVIEIEVTFLKKNS